MGDFVYEFEWDPAKARANKSKHGLDFELAATVLRDPLAVTIPDEEHSENGGSVDYSRNRYGRILYVVDSHVSVARKRPGTSSSDLG